jgi:hypothetical protein
MLGTNSNSSSSSFPKIGAHPFFHPRVGRYIRFSVPFLASKPLSLVLHTPKGYIRFLFLFFLFFVLFGHPLCVHHPSTLGFSVSPLFLL